MEGVAVTGSDVEQPLREALVSALAASGMRSAVVGVALKLDQSDVIFIESQAAGGDSAPYNLVFKFMDAERLRARSTTSENWAVAEKSWKNESNFYALRASRVLRMLPLFTESRCLTSIGDVAWPRVLHSQWTATGGAHATLLMHRVPPLSYYTPKVGEGLNGDETRVALRGLAAFHAAFWDTPADHFGAEFWTMGAWWRKSLRPREAAKFVTVFNDLCETIDILHDLKTPENLAFITALAGAAPAVSAALHQAPCRTLVHGDAKAANMLLLSTAGQRSAVSDSEQRLGVARGTGRPDVVPADSDSAVPSVVLLDFQWTGWAPSGAADVAYLLLGSAAPEVILGHDNRGGEAALLQFYHAELVAATAPRATMSFEQFSEAYALECIDYMTTAVPLLLAGLTHELIVANKQKHGWLTHEFDATTLRWFLERAVELGARIYRGEIPLA